MIWRLRDSPGDRGSSARASSVGQPHLNQSIARATNSREPLRPVIEPETEMVEAGGWQIPTSRRD